MAFVVLVVVVGLNVAVVEVVGLSWCLRREKRFGILDSRAVWCGYVSGSVPIEGVTLGLIRDFPGLGDGWS